MLQLNSNIKSNVAYSPIVGLICLVKGGILISIQIAYISKHGGRELNEDTVSVMQGEQTCIFVGDGLGGYAGGRQASQTAAKEIMAVAEKTNLLAADNMSQAAQAADHAVRQLQAESQKKMKTTLVCLTIRNHIAQWMHIGDSRLYYFHDKQLTAQTTDHSVSQLSVLMGEIELSQIRFHEDRNLILRALGSADATPDVSEQIELSPGDVFLLCTDGFWEFVYEDEMTYMLEYAADPQDWLNKMEALLCKRIPEYTDNYTAVAVFC